MPTRISRYADGVMEAAWLAALIVVPVFFNVYSSRIFEPDKITLLRTLALLILAAWIVKLVDQGGPRWERVLPGESKVRMLLRVPLAALVGGLAVLYLISTVLSVTPYTSFWGSYQRLQGTYTTLSYVVVFASIVGNLRKRVQVDRLISAAVLSSLPVSLYGVLQRYGVDPIPWGGDVVARIASNMGNSIFVAAYLIMVFPLTVLRIVESFEALLTDRGRMIPNFLRSTGYVFIGALQAIAIYFSGSRGPWLGLGASLVVLWLGLSLIWRKRWMTISGVSVALTAGLFLVVLNIPNGPLESLRDRPEFGRLGQLLDAQSRTGRVRVLIWQGAVELVQPHEALEYPGGQKDNFNFLRPLIGYGPESMYVAYNRFYQPELTLVEKRNASPDRSHNETWDSLVITGVLGLILYLSIFGSVLYYGLKWLGLIRGARQRNLFLAFYVIGGALSMIGFVLAQGIAYLGVALPFGMIAGVILYLILASLSKTTGEELTPDARLRAYVLLGLVGAVAAHFIEINFGIAIAATRTYFWSYAGMILAVGYLLPLHNEYHLSADELKQIKEGLPAESEKDTPEQNEIEAAPPVDASKAPPPTPTRAPTPASGGRRAPVKNEGGRTAATAGRKKRQPGRPVDRLTRSPFPGWMREAWFAAGVVTIILVCLGFSFVSNSSRSTSAFDLIWSSLTLLVNEGSRPSYGLLALVLTTWVVGCVTLTSESSQSGQDKSISTAWPKMLAVALGSSFLLTMIFWFWHANGLAALNRVSANTIEIVMDQVEASEQILSRYYIYLLGLVLALAAILPSVWSTNLGRWAWGSVGIGVVALGIVFAVARTTNLQVVQADIAFKTADLFARSTTWPVSIRIYNRARDLAPNEDYYYLFLGRAYLEYGKTLEDATQRENLIRQAADDLLEAKMINPLNTDHTANLARLYSLWSSYTTDAALKQERAETADRYFSQAVMLSPQSARLWDEWAVHGMNAMNQPEEAKQRLDRALEIDPYYDWTYGLSGDYLLRYASESPGNTPGQTTAFLIQASDYYTKAVELADPASPSQKYGYLVAYGGIQAQMGEIQKSIQAYEYGLEVWPENPERWRVHGALAQLYAQIGDNSRALEYAQSALSDAPEEQKAAIQELITQLGGQP